MAGSAAQLYDEDFVRWTEQQAAALRRAAELRINLPLDWEKLAEAIDSLGQSVKYQLRSRLIVTLEHLLKPEHSPAVDPRRGWIETIAWEPIIIGDLLEESLSSEQELTQLSSKRNIEQYA